MERYPNLKEEVGGLIPNCEISSLFDIKLARWSTASCALVLACRYHVSKKKKMLAHDHAACDLSRSGLPTVSLLHVKM